MRENDVVLQVVAALIAAPVFRGCPMATDAGARLRANGS